MSDCKLPFDFEDCFQFVILNQTPSDYTELTQDGFTLIIYLSRQEIAAVSVKATVFLLGGE